MATGMTPSPRPSDPRQAFRLALARYRGPRLAAIREAMGLPPAEDRLRPAAAAEELAERLDQPATSRALAAGLPHGARLAMSLMAVAESTTMPVAGLARELELLGVPLADAILPMLAIGLLAIEPDPEIGPVDDLASAISAPRARVAAHPTGLRVTRPVRPEGGPPAVSGEVTVVREADGLEPIVRLGALWQRAGAEPIRQTQQGTLYKRDRERVMEDPALAGPIADALTPLPNPAGLWLALAYRVGLVEPDASGQKLMATSPEFWSENALHLPQMIATGWLGLRDWQESAVESVAEGDEPASPYLRPSVFLWLATREESEWTALDDLAAFLDSIAPGWDRPTLAPEFVPAPTATPAPARRKGRPSPGPSRGVALLETMLLGAAYPLGLVRAAEERGSGRRVVQLTPLGRYVLAAGPTPPPRPTFDQFLFVQPNFEVIAYRQGLTPQVVGRLSRFAWWSQIGAAIELRLTRESILLGLDGGLTPKAMLEVLRRHSQRPLPPGVVDAVRNWATHRERVTYYAGATLLEFESPEDRARALAAWPPIDDESPPGSAPIEVADRFLLVEDESTIPSGLFTQRRARDYRDESEPCILVEPDGVTMRLDRSRSDLLVDAEIARFTDERPAPPALPDDNVPPPRLFAVTLGSLRRGVERGLTADTLADWYARRAASEVPAAVRLLLASATGAPIAPPVPTRRVVLTLPEPWMLDGFLQHPTTSRWLGDRLGPTAVDLPEENLEPFRKALRELGIAVNDGFGGTTKTTKDTKADGS